MGQIVVSFDTKKALDRIVYEAGDLPKIIYQKDSFLVDDAHELIAEAYKASEQTKHLIVVSKTYNTISQNALLKILEEPPPNIEITLIAPSRSIFLPTIRSRLPLRVLHQESELAEPAVDFDRASLADIFEIAIRLNKTENEQARDEARAMLMHATRWMMDRGKSSQKLLDMIDRSYRLLALHSTAPSLVVALLLQIIEVRDDHKTTR